MNVLSTLAFYLVFNAQVGAQTPLYNDAIRLSTWGNSLIEFSSVERFKVSFNNDETLLAAGNTDGLVIWNTATGKPHKNLTNQTISIYDLGFSPDNKYLIAVGTSHPHMAFQVWDAHTFDLIGTYFYDTARIYGSSEDGTLFPETFYAFDYVPNGQFIVITTSLHDMLVWKIGKKKPKSIVKLGHAMWDVEYNEKHDLIVTCTNYNTLNILKLNKNNLRLIAHRTTNHYSIEDVSISPNGSLVTYNSRDSFFVHSTTNLDSITSWELPKSIIVDSSDLLAIKNIWSITGEYFISGHDKNQLIIWDYTTKTIIDSVTGLIDNPGENEYGYNWSYPYISKSGKILCLSNDAGIIYLFKRNE